MNQSGIYLLDEFVYSEGQKQKQNQELIFFRFLKTHFVEKLYYDSANKIVAEKLVVRWKFVI